VIIPIEHVYNFDSEADMRRHFVLFHNGIPTKSHVKIISNALGRNQSKNVLTLVIQ